MLSRGGLRTVQTIGVPEATLDLQGVDAVVAALKSRTIPVEDAVDRPSPLPGPCGGPGRSISSSNTAPLSTRRTRAISALWLEALVTFTGSDFTLACPAFPANGRTVYRGHLFVRRPAAREQHERPPADADAGLQPRPSAAAPDEPPGGPRRVRGCRRRGRGFRAAFGRDARRGARYVIVDAITDRHLRTIGLAAADWPLITGGSGVAMGLPEVFRASAMPPGIDERPSRLPRDVPRSSLGRVGSDTPSG